MAATKKGLGRGLSALIPDDDMEFLSRVARGDLALSVPVTSSLDGGVSESAATKGLNTPINDAAMNVISEAKNGEAPPEKSPLWVEIAAIEANPYQPRRTFAVGEMEDLVASVREHGIIQPILVRPQPAASNISAQSAGNSSNNSHAKQYQLIAGERRWRAAQEAGLSKVPVVIRVVNDQQALELALIENVQRHDISVLDAARAYRRLGQEFSLSQEDIARRVGKSRPAISNTMRLLDLPEEAQIALEDGSISEGHGRAILLAPGEGARRAVFRRIIRDKLTVRDAEEASRRALTVTGDSPESLEGKAEKSQKSPSAKLSTTEMKALRATEEELSKALGTRVRIRSRAKGGQISIEYYSPDDLDQLLLRLRRSV